MTLLKLSGIARKDERGFSIKNINLSLKSGEKVAIAGETGSGKSTLLKIVAGLAQPDKGNVMFEGERVKGPEEKLVAGHPGIAYLSQQFELPGFLRVEQVLRYANTLSVAEAHELYEICHIGHLLERRTDQLSGGERQRIAIARLLLGSPKLLLLDEPFSNLDGPHKKILKSVISAISGKLNITLMMVSHDPQDTLPWADKIMVLRDGALQQKGTPVEIYYRPENEYIAGLFGSYNLLSEAQAKPLRMLKGLLPKEKQWLIRPEKLRLMPKEADTLRATVTGISFWGSFWELEVKIKGGKLLKVRTVENDYKIGQPVYLFLTHLDVWYV